MKQTQTNKTKRRKLKLVDKISTDNKMKRTDYNTNPKVSEIRKEILEESHFIDVKPYSHNIVGFQLRALKDLTDDDFVYETIVQFGLDKRGWSVSEDWAKENDYVKPSKKECRKFSRKMMAEAYDFLRPDPYSSESDDSESDDSESESSSSGECIRGEMDDSD